MERDRRPDGATSKADQTRLLAIGSLFGIQFLNEADRGLISAIQQSPDAWADLLQAVWRVSTNGAVIDPQPDEATPDAMAIASPPPVGKSPSPSPLAIFDPEVDAQVASSPPRDVSREEVRKYLVGVIVDKTGYPPETFEEPLDFEADLGIDSIKQVEALGEVRQHFQLPLDENFRMRDYPTLDAAADYIVSRLRGEPQAPPSRSENGETDPVEHEVYL
jgi:acyl carrier protein